jgi:glycosyltransferase involved in cell wall biosynthesis
MPMYARVKLQAVPQPVTHLTDSVEVSSHKHLPEVAIVVNSLPPYRLHVHQRVAREMGQEILLHTVCTHEVDYLHPYRPTPEINTISFGPGQPFTRQLKVRYVWSEWRKAGRIIRWLATSRINAVVLLGYNDAGRIRILRWCYRRGLPCLLFGDSNIRSDRTNGPVALMKGLLVPRFVRWATALLVCGRLGRQYWAKYGATSDRMFDFPYEPDYELIQNLSTEKIALVRERFGFRADRRRIVFAGRFIKAKQPRLLIEAFAEIAKQRPNWDLVMVGAEDPILSHRGRLPLEKWVPAELRGRVIFTGFQEEQWVVSAIYRASDVLCLPSDNEPWALVINEAVAAGQAIVASEVVGAAAELVRDGINGRVVPSRDLKSLVEALLDVTSANRIDAMRANSAAVLADWRKRGDPIDGLRSALKFAKVI